MTPRHPLVRHARERGVGTIALLIVLICGAIVSARAAGAEPAPLDTLSAPTAAAPLTRHRLLDGALRADRLAHASLALAIGTGVGLCRREPAAGAAAAITLAGAKELLDDRFDRGDFAAGAVGAGLAWLIVAALTR